MQELDDILDHFDEGYITHSIAKNLILELIKKSNTYNEKDLAVTAKEAFYHGFKAAIESLKTALPSIKESVTFKIE